MHFELNDRPEQTASANHSIFSSDDNKLRPSPSLPDTAVSDLRRLGRAADADAESPTSPRVTTFNDPYNIGHGIKTDAEIAELSSRKRGKRLANYHRKQNDLITALLKPMEEHTEDARVEENLSRLPVKIAVRASLIANISLAVWRYLVRSLSLLATGIDSVFDVGSNVLLFYIHRKSSRMDVNKWPVGGARLETIGNVSVRDLVKHGDKTLTLHIPSIVAVASALGVKFLLFLYCHSLRSKSSQVEVLWEDHRNDLFINSFGLLMSAGGSKLAWYLDPIGAIVIAVGIILIIYKAMTFSNEIEKIDTVRAYHDYFVEVDVVMDANTPLWKAHDISQQLQDKIEVLPNVGRAFVHVDHETTHIPVSAMIFEHRKHV
ncbi:hypothetical protein BJV77DRAFT_1059336 [Russula vinacea]|nr:hypothetical protein BJV77DRAFT_1059336 [Russula vinacea]